MAEILRIKPHHFIDIITGFGAGISAPAPHPFGHAVHTVTVRILAERDIVLEMELGADDICAPCRYNNAGVCEDTIDTSYRPQAPSSKRQWNLRIDGRWCERLGLSAGDRLSAREFCVRLQQHAGDLTDIYREIPAARTAERQTKLEAGVAEFLS